jgi:hypothetical protein
MIVLIECRQAFLGNDTRSRLVAVRIQAVIGMLNCSVVHSRFKSRAVDQLTECDHAFSVFTSACAWRSMSSYRKASAQSIRICTLLGEEMRDPPAPEMRAELRSLQSIPRATRWRSRADQRYIASNIGFTRFPPDQFPVQLTHQGRYPSRMRHCHLLLTEARRKVGSDHRTYAL